MAQVWRLIQAHRKRVAVGIVLVGFISGVVIYLTASPPSDNPLGYRPLDTKTYVRELELYGGKANVLASEFMEWFASLWQGRTLAYTVAGISVLIALLFLFVSIPLDHPNSSEGSDEDAGRQR